ncbi:NAD(P)H-hydrate dehydratase [Micrococcus terreus]|uniref:NAD(P)H-hydrate dehydratase n=1 Tax=Micrococcus terreus TaxID=574650 RepID=UPI00254A6FE9|nr:NAD(P)H-hydrate dehydratase [Micrococcus terreus]MDK7702285.1 NAD(P)H-hydrate dehydratase [Micrococcus terreus]WOO98851.1 NAD(P)H-hydrate dehydratase [Micrococcus terreus]
MLRAHTGTAVRAAERPLLEAGQGDALMRRAAWGLAQHTLAELRRRGPVAGSTVAALVGSGNNGGDALWALSFLRRRGVHAVAVPASRSRALHDDGHAALLAAGGQVGEQIPSGAAVVIDGILGTGARGAFELPAGLVLPEGATVVACDVPSGVDADTGQVLGEVIPAEVTVTFGAVKAGLLLGAGAQAAGRVELVEIGLVPSLGAPDLLSVGEPELRAAFAPPRWDDHKYSRGVLGVAAGSEQYPGAAVLVCRAALASGLGMVRLAAPEGVRQLVLGAAPEVVAQEQAGGKATAWVCGPGLGEDESAADRLEAVVALAAAQGLPVVLDASALSLVSLAQVRRMRAGGAVVVMTPHRGELVALAQRLGAEAGLDAGEWETELDADPVRAVRELAEILDVMLVAKGPSTVIAEPSGTVFVQTEGGAELATGGTGDCLAGMIGAALARGAADAERPAVGMQIAAAVRLHGLAGRAAAADGPFGASALPDQIRSVLATAAAR